jgi:hypothetical protein
MLQRIVQNEENRGTVNSTKEAALNTMVKGQCPENYQCDWLRMKENRCMFFGRLLIYPIIKRIVSREQKVRKHFHTSFKNIMSKWYAVGLRHPNPKCKKVWLKTAQAYTTGQKASGLVTQQSYLVGPVIRSGPNYETSQKERYKKWSPRTRHMKRVKRGPHPVFEELPGWKSLTKLSRVSPRHAP